MEWPLNEWIRCCLYIETAPDSFIQRSFRLILMSFNWNWKGGVVGMNMDLHSDLIPEWWQNDRMMPEWEVSQNSIFLYTSKNTFIPSHLVILSQFRMALNENYNGKISVRGHSIHFYSIPLTLIIPECCWNDGMRVKWGIFLKQGKTMNSKIPLISPSFGHSHSKSYAS